MYSQWFVQMGTSFNRYNYKVDNIIKVHQNIHIPKQSSKLTRITEIQINQVGNLFELHVGSQQQYHSESIPGQNGNMKITQMQRRYNNLKTIFNQSSVSGESANIGYNYISRTLSLLCRNFL